MNTDTPHLSPAQIYQRLLGYVKPYWLVFIASVLAMLVSAATETSLAAMMKPLMDGSFVDRDPTIIKLMPIVLIGIFLLRGAASFLTTYGLGWISRNIVKNIRAEMFQNLIGLPTAYYDHNTSGQLMAKLIYDVEQVADATTRAILVLIRDSLTILGLLAWMFYLNGKLSLIILITAPLTALLVYKISYRFRRLSKNIQQSVGDVGHISSEVIKGHREVKIFGSQQYEYYRFEQINQRNRRQMMKMISTDATSQPIIELISVLGLAGVIYFATRPEMLEQITVGTFISFITAMFMLLTPIKRITKINSGLQRGIAAAQSIFSLLDQQSELDTGSYKLAQAKGDIRYDKVSFIYDEAKGNVLSNVSFHAKAGQTIAFVGHSGSGKSTLVSLLPRFYHPSSGTISLDGINITDFPLADLRQHISLVNQQVILFNDTIRNNIAYGTHDNIGDSDIITAAKSAYAWDFIQAMPQGLDTLIGENGLLLSGGQRQRIAIARALLRNTPILILDEATASLDSKSERHIQAALDNLMQARTTLVIAHRLSTIEKADCIIVIHNGHIMESGTHAELLAKKSHYAELHRLQFQDSPA
jgi:subfamily B ATP-binding cassette protein MsbA